MKNMKKFTAMLLAVIMVLNMAVSASAADTNTITISNKTSGYEYEAYQVFKGDVTAENELENIAWGAGVDGDDLLTALKETESFKDCETVVDVATILSQNLDEDNDVAKAFADIVADYLVDGNGKVSTYNETSEVYDISGLEDGYYFVKTTKVPDATTDTATGSYTRYILKVVGNVKVNHKGNVPSVEKKIVENDVPTDNIDVNIGDEVTFTLTGTLPDEYANYKSYTYIFHDTLSEGLTYTGNENVKVYLDNNGTQTNITSKFTINYSGDVLIVSIKNLKDVENVSATSKIVVEYIAILNNSAEIGNNGNPNTVYLEYSNDPNWDGDPETGDIPTGDTPKDEVLVFTYELDVTKIDGTNKNTLKDAEFVLYRGEGENIEYAVLGTDNKVSKWTSNREEATTLKSDTDGKFVVIGLDAGTYYLEETKAPTGYNILEAPIELVISADVSEGAVKDLQITVGEETASGNADTGIVKTTVENNSGATLPSTGGIGTTIFYIAGAVLVLAAVVLLVTKRRMKAE